MYPPQKMLFQATVHGSKHDSKTWAASPPAFEPQLMQNLGSSTQVCYFVREQLEECKRRLREARAAQGAFDKE